MVLDFIHELAISPAWKSAFEAVRILCILQLFDVMMGILVAIRHKRMCSTIGWKGFTRKIATFVIVAMVAVVDPLVPFDITVGAAIAYSGWEGLSIIEKAGLLGVPVPAFIREALQKLRDAENVASLPKPIPVHVVQSAPMVVVQSEPIKLQDDPPVETHNT